MRSVSYTHLDVYKRQKKACEAAGVQWFEEATRGGTDGARLSYMGLPCPNLGTGGHNFHGPYECITAESMDKACLLYTSGRPAAK